MKLYLISDDSNIRTRLSRIFAEWKPMVLSKLELDFEENSMLIVSDNLLDELSDVDRQKIFGYRVMVLSMVPDFIHAHQYLQIGAMGYGNAMMHETHLHSAYQALEEGKVWLHPDFISYMIMQIRDANATKEQSFVILDVLSKREREVALMLGNGATHQEIATALDITTRTVKAHATAIYQKLDVKDRLALSILLHT
ncbi:LuxR C-terminal-related transcriptional regulator [Sulfuricurvum sp.]|uniref:response regulator transcription factor n=1 Tax=Sulfuricurvum sp. TaxID=2025608 RepID=UPI002616770D|nr:LuxR C-terminal-related transcriptional regulator [Sulfuricurvum sp.]MDD2267397.1 LuxR C-terminal-related transcriptional regulator [Sulfuricurvum sp.]MDD2783076.1 LuxR C-terminal-related transcriptional regulator [Sulfuricurvum sp.]